MGARYIFIEWLRGQVTSIKASGDSINEEPGQEECLTVHSQVFFTANVGIHYCVIVDRDNAVGDFTPRTTVRTIKENHVHSGSHPTLDRLIQGQNDRK
jgi:hypothetical protein